MNGPLLPTAEEGKNMKLVHGWVEFECECKLKMEGGTSIVPIRVAQKDGCGEKPSQRAELLNGAPGHSLCVKEMAHSYSVDLQAVTWPVCLDLE